MFDDIEKIQQNLMERTTNIESWACRSNVDNAKREVNWDLEATSAATEKATAAFKAYNIASKKHSKITWGLTFGLGFCLPFIVKYFNTPARWPLIAVASVFLVLDVIAIVKSPTTAVAVRLVNESKYWMDLSKIHLWYYNVLRVANIKELYKKVYEDTYKIVEEVCKDPVIKERFDQVKQDLGIDFDYVYKELKEIENQKS